MASDENCIKVLQNTSIMLTILTKYPDINELIERFEDAIHITSACEGLQDFERGFRLSAAFIHAIQNE